jgi:hypothetical protein
VGIPAIFDTSGSWLPITMPDGRKALQAQPPASLVYNASSF